MVTVREGSHVHQLLQLLSVAGEFPASSLHLLGKEDVFKALVHRLESVQDIRFTREGEAYRTKVLQVNGYREMRTVKLYSGVLPLLDKVQPEALAYYMNAFQQHRFSGNIYHVGRNHRVGEAIAMAMMAGLEFRPYVLPRLQKKAISQVVLPKPSFYVARDFKDNDYDEMDKYVYTRIVGAVFYPGGCYAVYNTRGAVMKWSGNGERKARSYLLELGRYNAGLRDADSALLLGNTPDWALQTILESDKSPTRRNGFNSVYQHIHYLPLDANGIHLLWLLTLPDWKEKVLNALFESEARLQQGYGFMDYDAAINGTYTLSHLDADLARLIKFREGIQKHTDKRFMVVCYPWQRDFLRAYLGEHVKLKIISMEELQNAIE
ncbi:MAG: hypothetical protein FWC27_04410 [Firmicutes bacterium]|nr:hypothetical protein [Bacillota bacterium]